MGSYLWRYFSPVFPIKWNVLPQFCFERNIANINYNPREGTEIVLFKFSSLCLMVWQSSRDLSWDLLLQPVPASAQTHAPTHTHTCPWWTPAAQVAITMVLSAHSCRILLLSPGIRRGSTLGRGIQVSDMLQKVTTKHSGAACLTTVTVLDPQEVKFMYSSCVHGHSHLLKDQVGLWQAPNNIFVQQIYVHNNFAKEETKTQGN